MEAELKNKSDNYIQLNEDEDILRLRIRDAEGNDTGNYLEFDLTDLEIPLTYQKMIEEDKKNRAYITNQIAIIDKKQDHKGKKLLSSNEEEKIKAMIEFYKKETEVLNMFLGENGVEKLLNGKKITWRTIEKIVELIEKQIYPQLKINAKSINDRIKQKYSNKRDDVIE